MMNALWAGGAEGISPPGQPDHLDDGHQVRREHGGTCRGVPYAPPYRLIVALGDTSASMYEALQASPEVSNYRDYVPPPYNLGWSVRTSRTLHIPGYTAPIDLSYAKPISP